ncbi:MAG TPA: vanadium-dependent haloperoxidase [Candidatus Binatia bacterium]|nr:vanadium-dependent haloperoxidase [Candidatus Binatia bacterium]
MRSRRCLFCFLTALCLSTRLVAADGVTDWNTAALNAIRALNTPPPAASRNLAILHASIYDAVNGVLRTHTPYLVTGQVPAGASIEATAVAAAHHVLVSLYPTLQADFDALYNESLATIREGPQKDHGIVWGRFVATSILQWRSTDGSAKMVNYVPGTEPGQWRPTISFGGIVRPALLPQWGSVTPFALANGSQFRPPAPPALNTQQYAADVTMVKAVGGTISAARTAEQTEIALFWGYGPGTATPPGHWNQIAQVVAANQGNTLAENARLFALLNIALADAAIVSWDCKYVYNFWRPITAIQEADTDSNPETTADPSWKPLLATPPFPEYTSGHSTFSAAAAVVLARFFDTDYLPFTVGTDDLPGVYHSYQRLSEAAHESGLSRIYGGIHFRFANLNGLSTGAAVGSYVYTNFLRPKKNRSRE